MRLDFIRKKVLINKYKNLPTRLQTVKPAHLLCHSNDWYVYVLDEHCLPFSFLLSYLLIMLIKGHAIQKARVISLISQITYQYLNL